MSKGCSRQALPESCQDAVRQLAKDFLLCYECTTCASTCPAFQTGAAKNPRKWLTLLQHAPEDAAMLIESAWWCCACYSCEVHCPQGIPLTSLFYSLKQLAFSYRLKVPDNVSRAFDYQKTGYGFACNETSLARRKAMGLPDLMMPDHEELTDLIDRVMKEKENDSGHAPNR